MVNGLSSNTKQIGDRGELLAEDFLKCRGYTILERNFRRHGGEIDLIAKLANCLVFVEVKAVHNHLFPAEQNVTLTKQKRLIQTARQYLAEHRCSNAEWQIDIVAIELGPPVKIEHIPNAVWAKPY